MLVASYFLIPLDKIWECSCSWRFDFPDIKLSMKGEVKGKNQLRLCYSFKTFYLKQVAIGFTISDLNIHLLGDGSLNTLAIVSWGEDLDRSFLLKKAWDALAGGKAIQIILSLKSSVVRTLLVASDGMITFGEMSIILCCHKFYLRSWRLDERGPFCPSYIKRSLQLPWTNICEKAIVCINMFMWEIVRHGSSYHVKHTLLSNIFFPFFLADRVGCILCYFNSSFFYIPLSDS